MLDKLEAVNRSLQAIGETRVNSLQSGLPDAAEAEAVLNETLAEVLQVGWHENIIESIRLTPDAHRKTIAVPSHWFEAEPVSRSAVNGKITIRTDPNDNQRKLFNVAEQSFRFTSPIELRVIHSAEFDDLGFPLKNYISARTARTFQERVMGSVSLDSFTSRAEEAAWGKLLESEAEVANNNVLTDSAYMRAITGRNNRLSWR